MSSGVLVPEDTPEQKAALARLETLLALTEGWVDHVVTAAIGDRLGSATKLQEAVRRRRAAGGPAERTFATLVGLELRPRRLRDAAALWQELDAAVGMSGRDEVWEHPDLLPGPLDLDNPKAFVAGMSGSSSFSDADLEALVSGALPSAGLDEAGKPDVTDGGEPGPGESQQQ
jgi:putative hydrolase